MAKIQRYPLSLASGAVMVLPTTGSYLRLFDTTGALDVALDIGGHLKALEAGQGWKSRDGREFNYLTITNSTAGAITGYLLVADDEFVDHALTLSSATIALAALSGVTSAGTQVNAASTQLLAANAARRYLLVQNNSATVTIYLNLAGAAATTTNGIKLGPGESYEAVAGIVPVGAITAIGSAATGATEVVVVEGT